MSRPPATPRAESLPLDEERIPPQQREDGRPELPGEVDPHAQPGAGVAPHLGERSAQRPHLDLLDCLAGVGRVLDHDDEADEQHRAGAGRDREGPVPTPAVQRHRQRGGRGHRTELPDHATQLGDDRCLLDVEPQRDQSQHAREDHRVADAQEHTCREPHLEAVREGEPQLADRHQDEPDDEQETGPEAVQEDAHRNLHPGIHDELDDRERRELRRRDVEAFCRNETRDTQARAVEDGDRVDRERDRPDDPGAATADVVDLAPEGSGHRSILGRIRVCRVHRSRCRRHHRGLAGLPHVVPAGPCRCRRMPGRERHGRTRPAGCATGTMTGCRMAAGKVRGAVAGDRPPTCAGVAQLVAHLSCKQGVEGSSPFASSNSVGTQRNWVAIRTCFSPVVAHHRWRGRKWALTYGNTPMTGCGPGACVRS